MKNFNFNIYDQNHEIILNGSHSGKEVDSTFQYLFQILFKYRRKLEKFGYKGFAEYLDDEKSYFDNDIQDFISIEDENSLYTLYFINLGGNDFFYISIYKNIKIDYENNLDEVREYLNERY